jgi:hypothetical protein
LFSTKDAMPLTMPYRSALIFAGILLLFAPWCSAAILLDNGQLTVQAEGKPLTAILAEIGRQGDITIQMKGALPEQRVSANFGPVPLEKGLKRIMRKINYLAVYDQNGRITQLVIWGSMPAQRSGPSPRLQAAPAAPAELPDTGNQKPEDRGQKSEDRGQTPEGQIPEGQNP